MIIFSTSSKPITLPSKILLLANGWTRLLKRHGLEVTRRYRLGIVPSYLESAETHEFDAIVGSDEEGGQEGVCRMHG